MKKLLSLFTVILLIALLPAKAQFHMGVKGGLNLANMNVSNLPAGFTNNMVASFHLGAYVEKPLIKSFGIESGLYLSGKGLKEEFSQSILVYSISGSVKITPYYLELPVNAVYNLNIRLIKLRFFAGPYIAYGLAGRVNSDFSATGLPIDLSSLGLVNESRNIVFGSDTTSDVKPFDFGVNIGVGAEIKKFTFNIQYGLGFVNVAAENATAYEGKNRLLTFSLGYRIF